ncbi:hypothetical protein Tco_0587533 [Tanacetum coccineum]
MMNPSSPVSSWVKGGNGFIESLMSSNMGGVSFLKLSLSEGMCTDILRTLTRFLFQDNFYQLMSNPYSLWSKRDAVGPTDYRVLKKIQKMKHIVEKLERANPVSLRKTLIAKSRMEPLATIPHTT